MKRIALYGFSLCLLIVLTVACQQEDDGGFLRKNSFSLRITIDDLGNNAGTRASVESSTDENTINSLRLVFFDYNKEGSGTYVGYYEPASGLRMNATIDVPATITGPDGTSAVTLDFINNNYTILAYANLTGSYEQDLDGFIQAGNTENYVLNNASVLISGVGTDEADNSQKVSSDNLFMTARIVKMAGDTGVELKLTRGLSRFEIENRVSSDQYALASASIWAASTATAAWEGHVVAYNRTKRFYGLERGADFDGENIQYGLYAFENIVVNPGKDDELTTCLIVGLKNSSGKVTYYRVNVHQVDAPQQLKRNYSYKITILNVAGDGASTEYEAFTQNENLLYVTVNNWNLDDNGMIVTDGVNTLGIPVKRVTLNPEGDIREYSVYTVGTGTLEIFRTGLPDGITAEISGNLLRITATALPSVDSSRKGSIEISFAGLKGTIDISQEPMNAKVLTLDRYIVTNFPPVGRYGISGGPLVITASGPWVAELFNTVDDDENPGFSFVQLGAPVTHLSSATYGLGNILQVYTTGNNTLEGERAGFLQVSLVEDPEYSVVVPLVQNAPDIFVIEPATGTEGVRFYADKRPINTSLSIGNGYEFAISTGGVEWTPVLAGTHPDKFSFVRYGNKIFVEAAEVNTTTLAYTATLSIVTTEASPRTVQIRLTQEAAALKVNYSGIVPTNGGTVTVNVVTPNMTWKAEIIEEWDANAHPAYLNSAGVKTIDGQLASTTSFTVGFGKLNAVNVTPVVKVKVSIEGLGEINQIIEISQSPKLLTSLMVMDIRHYQNASLGGSSSNFAGYNNFLRSPKLFGSAGICKVPGVAITEIDRNAEPGVISSDYRYLHAGGRPNLYSNARFASIENWRNNANTDGVIVFACDVSSDIPFRSTNTLGKLGYSMASYNSRIAINDLRLTGSTAYHRNIMKFLLEDGPFGKVNNPSGVSFTINSSSVSVNYPEHAVPAITNANGKALLVIDIKNGLVYNGESRMFNTGYNTAISADKDRFLGNLLALILKTAENGTDFAKCFESDAEYAKMLKTLK